MVKTILDELDKNYTIITYSNFKILGADIIEEALL